MQARSQISIGLDATMSGKHTNMPNVKGDSPYIISGKIVFDDASKNNSLPHQPDSRMNQVIHFFIIIHHVNSMPYPLAFHCLLIFGY